MKFLREKALNAPFRIPVWVQLRKKINKFIQIQSSAQVIHLSQSFTSSTTIKHNSLYFDSWPF